MGCKEPDLELKKLGQYYGTDNYYRCLGTLITDGVMYVMKNGYSWLVNDIIILVKFERKLRKQPFIYVRLQLNGDGSALLVFEDGNYNRLHVERYEWTDAKRELEFFYVGGVLLLKSEY